MILGIEVNALARTQYTGVENYVFELISEMKKLPLRDSERVFLYSSEVIAGLGDLPTGWEWKILKLPLIKKGWTHLRLSFELLVNPPDIFFSPAHEIPLGALRTTIVNTIHDIAFVHVPEVYTFFVRLRQRLAIWWAVRVADKILCVSETTCDDLVSVYKVPVNRIRITRLGMRRIGIESNVRLPHYLLTIGRVETKKNIEFLIDVFDAYCALHPKSDLMLKIAGKPGDGADRIMERIKGSEFKDRIEVLGYVEDMNDLLSGAWAYTFPSSYEGFGLPALEAMDAGVPVIASDIPALREVCADSAIFASPTDADAWIDALEAMTDDQRALLIRKGYERIKFFSWEKTAQKTWKAIRDVCKI